MRRFSQHQIEQPDHTYPQTIVFGEAPQELAAVSMTPPDPILLARLRAQVEFYFSAVNLSRDVFLRTLLQENHGSVSLERICHFPKVRELYRMHYVTENPSAPCDPRVLQMALEGSVLVNVSEDCKWITLMDGRVAVHVIPSTPPPTMPDLSDTSTVSTPMPRAPLEPPASPSSSTQTSSSAGIKTCPMPKPRTTVIVRDLSEDVILDDIVKAFTLSSGPTPRSVRRDVANTWYITFHTEQQAVQAVLETSGRYIRGDQPIRARIKSEVLAHKTNNKNYRAPPPPPVLYPSSVPYTSYEYHYAAMPPPPPPTPSYSVSLSPAKGPYHPTLYAVHPHLGGPLLYHPCYEPVQRTFDGTHHRVHGPPPMPYSHEQHEMAAFSYPRPPCSNDRSPTHPLRYEPVPDSEKESYPIPSLMVPVLNQQSQKPQQQRNRNRRSRKSGRGQKPFQKLEMNGLVRGSSSGEREETRSSDLSNGQESRTKLENEGLNAEAWDVVVAGDSLGEDDLDAERTGLKRSGSVESNMSDSSRSTASSRNRHRSGKNSRNKKHRTKKRDKKRNSRRVREDAEFPELVKTADNDKGGLKGYADALKKVKPTSLATVPSGECTAQDQEDTVAASATEQVFAQAMSKLSIGAERKHNTAGGESSNEHWVEGASAAWSGKVSCSTDDDDGWGTSESPELK